ncbi:MAG: hypothetical protein K1X72_11020 [Pyrinomonadaceae bacterium]|nr:hypothetical protein [Pyrinomonadaceae bacterium]
MNRKSPLSLIIILIFCVVIKADIAPDSGYSQVSADLIISTTQDLSNYRFFLEFSGDCNEIKIKNNDTTTIPPQGGGVRYSSGTLLAVPKKSLKDFADELTFAQQTRLADLIRENKIEGVIKLIDHSFNRVVKDGENWTNLTYRLEKEETTLKAVKEREILSTAPNIESRILLYKIISYGLIGGVLVALGVIGGGIYLFRKRRQKR